MPGEANHPRSFFDNHSGKYPYNVIVKQKLILTDFNMYKKNGFYVWMMMLGAVITAGAITGCNKDDGDGGTTSAITSITAVVENGSQYNTAVETVEAWIGEEYLVASGKYASGGFTLNLPETVPAAHLGLLVNEAGKGATVSDAEARVTSIDFFDAYKGDTRAGRFEHATHPEESTELTVTRANYMYADRDARVSGTTTSGEHNASTTLSITLKKGWNILYVTSVREVSENGDESYTRTVSNTISNTAPAGMKWYYNKN
jgi:hypothetical protein